MESLEHQPRRRRRRRSRKRARYSAVVVALLSLLGILAYESVHFARIVEELPPIVWHKPWGGIERYEPTPDYRGAYCVSVLCGARWHSERGRTRGFDGEGPSGSAALSRHSGGADT